MPEVEGKGILFVWWLPGVLGVGTLAISAALYFLASSRLLKFLAVPLGLAAVLLVILATWSRHAGR